MKTTFTVALVVSLLIFHSPRVQSEDAEVEVLHKWPQRFYGEVSIEIEETVEDGWQVVLTFGKPVERLAVWNVRVDSVSDDKTVYVLKNQSWNPILEAGRLFKIHFFGYKKFGQPTPSVSAEFSRLGEGSGF